MFKEASFKVRGKVFNFTNSISGIEEIKIEDNVLSSKKSWMGGKHRFEYEGDQYEVKVKVGIKGLFFIVKLNGGKIKLDEHEDQNKLSQVEMVMCYWPLILVILGDAVGGLCGG